MTPAVIAIVGGGPRGTGLLERLCANAEDVAPGLPIEVHLVDPYPFGAGRVWRYDQSPLLKTNSKADDVTLFTDASATISGPVRPGPTVTEWAAGACGGPSDEVAAQIRALDGGTFPTRQVQSQYLEYAFRRAVAEAPPGVTVRVHPHLALDVRDVAGGRQEVVLDGEEPLVADTVLLALGHLDRRPAAQEEPLVAFADRHGLAYVPTGYTGDLDLSALRPGQDVLVRGLGLAFVDLMVLVTEGRGGRYEERADGTLDYLPSGREPRLYVGSRRGVPYHGKISYHLQGAPPEPPRYLTPAAVAEILSAERVEFDAAIRPLALKDTAYAWYRELFTAHPGRVLLGWEEFAGAFDAEPWDSAAMRALVESAVPKPADRFDVAAIDRPLRGLTFPDADALQGWMLDYLADDVERGADPARSPALGAFLGLLGAFGGAGAVVASGKLTARSYAHEFSRFFGFFNFLDSGPPGHRLAELSALVRAGLVRFVGADMWVRADEARGLFVGGSGSQPETVSARALVEARLPAATVTGSRDPLLNALLTRGEVAEEVLDDPVDGVTVNTGRLRVRTGSYEVLDASGRPHPRRLALGSFTNGFTVGAFSRPRTDAPFFRQNDATARRVLEALRAAAVTGSARPSSPPAA